MDKYRAVRGTVVEVATHNYIHIGNSIQKAEKIAKKLNSGVGFNGWTPSFLLENIS